MTSDITEQTHTKNDVKIGKRICDDYNSGTPPHPAHPSPSHTSIHPGLHLFRLKLGGTVATAKTHRFRSVLGPAAVGGSKEVLR